VSDDRGAPPVVAVVADLNGTAAVAAAVAGILEPGDLLVLGGPLGAGKTTFTKALAAALGVGEVVTSPTFTLVRTYRTARGWDLVHADLYRIEHLSEAVDLGLPELLDYGAVAAVEWGQRALPALLDDHLQVELQPLEGQSGASGARRITLRASGPGWTARLGSLRAAVGATGLVTEAGRRVEA
jgi:tRNA threonylcarbamoyladenosine biosynthesis protein TsaE